jgi:hypothetical protein
MWETKGECVYVESVENEMWAHTSKGDSWRPKSVRCKRALNLMGWSRGLHFTTKNNSESLLLLLLSSSRSPIIFKNHVNQFIVIHLRRILDCVCVCVYLVEEEDPKNHIDLRGEHIIYWKRLCLSQPLWLDRTCLLLCANNYKVFVCLQFCKMICNRNNRIDE